MANSTSCSTRISPQHETQKAGNAGPHWASTERVVTAAEDAAAAASVSGTDAFPPRPSYRGFMLSAAVICKVSQGIVFRKQPGSADAAEKPSRESRSARATQGVLFASLTSSVEELHQAHALISKVLRFARAGHGGQLPIAEQAAQTARCRSQHQSILECRMEAATRRWRNLFAQIY